ncbi:GGDEF domain-containing protein [Paenisporosarcina indica]|uniref:GGDEF domain-containing protein n=1 Tax=Paenisporosarcina indica TaxID=650093 RepID=UPI00094F90AE|nr:GGDEF domain-containing protein [Paenisporosarcina indica]
MWKSKLFDIVLIVISVFWSLSFAPLHVDLYKYIIAFIIYLLFSAFYAHLRIIQRKGTTNIDYGITYSQSFAAFAGPFGLLIYEIVHRFTIYFQRKYANTADPNELADTLYNISSFVLYNTVAFIFFYSLYPFAESIPFGYFILFFVTTIIINFQSDILLTSYLYLSNNLHTWTEVLAHFKNRTLLDVGKVALTNSLLYYFLMESQWEMLIIVFALNYVVSRSYVSKQESIQNELERDRFRKMAYTDFMTGLSNRAWMDKQMAEINGTGEKVGIVVADIDKFKRINDSYNHAVGDKVIQHFAEILKAHVNVDDGLFRTGGEEFTLFLRGRSFEECGELLEKLRMHVSVHPVSVDFNGTKRTISYTVSFGLYFDEMTDKLPMERAYVVADQLLLGAKDKGRNRINTKNGLKLL